MMSSEDYIRLGWHVVPRDLPTDPVHIGWFNVPRDMLLTHDVRVGAFKLNADMFGKGPRITSATGVNAKINMPFSYQIVATNSPDSFDATGLPPGLSINTTTGEITGTPTAEGTTSVQISATNAEGTGSRTLSIRVGDVPVISSTSASGVVNAAFSYQVVASGGPFTNFSATGLPAGLSINNSGLITGRATATGTSTAQITATNVFGTSASQPLSVNITAAVVGNPAFYGYVPGGSTVADIREPAFITSLTQNASPAAGTVLSAPIPIGAQGVLFAFPATLGAGTTCFQNPPGLDVLAGLVKEIIEVLPGVNYQVIYQWVPSLYPSSVTFVLTI